MKRYVAVGALVFATTVPMSGCPSSPGYGFQIGLWHLTFANNPEVYGIHFHSGGPLNIAHSVDVGFGTLPGNFFWEVNGNEFTMEQVVDSNTHYRYTGTMSSHYEMSGDWQLEGDPYIGQFSAIHSDPLPIEE